jgi:hypothetical protein
MLRALMATMALLLVLPAAANAAPAYQLKTPTGLHASAEGRAVAIAWDRAKFPSAARHAQVVLKRGDTTIATLPATATSFTDEDVAAGERHAYAVASTAKIGGRPATSPWSAPVEVRLPGYLVGAATRDITPDGPVNLGGFGLGDGTVIPDAIVGRGGFGGSEGERIAARAIVVDDGEKTVAIANIETQGMFAAYQDGAFGLDDIANQVAAEIPGLPADHILIASDHSHSGPDTIGAWGGVEQAYLAYIRDQAVAAIKAAYADRAFADLRAGRSDASDLIYNQSCTEALNQGKDPEYPGPEVCATPGKDGMFRILQATAPSGRVVATLTSFAAHSTAGGGRGLHGDWPQFVSEAMTETYGGTGIAMVGALGGTQPCRAACAFTKAENPGYDVADRKTAIVLNYMAHVRNAVNTAEPVTGPVAAAKRFIREPITGPAVIRLFTAGHHTGTRLLRSHENPWVVANTVRTVASAIRVGGVLFAGTPGEGFPAIGAGIRGALTDEQDVFQLGLANDQLGYLIAPAAYVPVIAAEAPVNDNIIFNVSPTIGDHVMCADIALALETGLQGAAPAQCAPYLAQDAAGDPVASVPAGGVIVP